MIERETMAKKPDDKAAKPEPGNEPKKQSSAPDAAPAAAPDATSAGGGTLDEQPIMVNAQYTKDLSFEAPGAPLVFGLMGEEQPDIGVNVNVNVNPLQEKTYEVVLAIQAQCKIKEQIGFILELEYAGVFTLNIPEEHLQAILLIECPRLLFPFARNILADVTRDGGFPPLMLGPIDFVSMFQNRIQEAGEAEGKAKGEAGGENAGGGAGPDGKPAKS